MQIEALVFAVLLKISCYCDVLYKLPPDTGLDVKQLIDKYGYPFENHTVQTKDGYILELHRIPHGRNVTYKNRPPVLLIPGILCGSADWVNMGPSNSLGFILADRGYDVWLANYRGTRWSRRHATLDPDVDTKKYWNFSIEEIAEYDIPTFVDCILNVTKHEKLFYIGHSLGTSTFFAFASTMPDYNKKFRLAVALSPTAYQKHSQALLRLASTLFKLPIELISRLFGEYEVLPYSPFISLLARNFCHDGSIFQGICELVVYGFGGYNPEQLNKTMIPVIASNTPAGASVRQVLHYGQLCTTTFAKYDFGLITNLKVYGRTTPPIYNISTVTTPVALYYGSRDPFCKKADVDRTASDLPNLVLNKEIDKFSHTDMLWGIDVVQLVYNDVLRLMKEH